ncbi:hypothetical protein CMI45_01905 [Candidatus Pacearchaeota archaeon]|nr:hypothetical protein [Candidatus Pacearchaeota archaeon]
MQKVNGDEQDLSYVVFGVEYSHDEILEELRELRRRDFPGFLIRIQNFSEETGDRLPLSDCYQYALVIQNIYQSLSEEKRGELFN